MPSLTKLKYLLFFITMYFLFSFYWLFSAQITQNSGQRTIRVSISSNSKQGNKDSICPAISENGHFIAFYSLSDNLVPNDENNSWDIFVRDCLSSKTERLFAYSLLFSNIPGDVPIDPSISANGRFVAFTSNQILVPNDTNLMLDVFVKDRKTGRKSRVSIASDGTQANWWSEWQSISKDGRYVVFGSWATNLVAGIKDSLYRIYIHDRNSKQTKCISISSQGQPCNHYAYINDGAISDDGRYVVFSSWSDNLVPNDTNGYEDVFFHDYKTQKTVRISMAFDGKQGNAASSHPTISGDGRFVAFRSYATNLVKKDTNSMPDIFIYNTKTKKNKMVSISSDGKQGNDISSQPSISADGRFVAFWSYSTNLVQDSTVYAQVYIHDCLTGKTAIASVDSKGNPGNGHSDYRPIISRSGRFVTFPSPADNLVPDDTNNCLDVFRRDLWDINLTPCNLRESLSSGSSYNITWTSEGNIGDVKIEYSIDSGKTWKIVINSTDNDGLYTWRVPRTPSSHCLLKISAAEEGDPCDISDDYISIIN